MLRTSKWMMLSGWVFLIFSESSDKIVPVEFTQSEQRAIRVEMIEMDITIRTIVSMISLNRPDRLMPWFQRLSDLQTESSAYHKKGILSATGKWKQHAFFKYINSIQTESAQTVKYLEKQKEQEFKDLQWDVIYDSNKKIIENCRQCHIKSAVEIKFPLNQ